MSTLASNDSNVGLGLRVQGFKFRGFGQGAWKPRRVHKKHGKRLCEKCAIESGFLFKECF